MNLYNEFGEPLESPSERKESFYAIIKFDISDEPDHFAEIYVSHDDIKFQEDNTTLEQYNEVQAYAEKAQQSIIDFLNFCKDDADTKSWLNQTAHW